MTAMISDSSPEAGGRTKPRERPAGREVLHGRAAGQRMVRDLLRHAGRGAGGVALVEGDPGTGRSWLLRDATDEAAELGLSLAAGAADQLGQTIPFFALRTALRAPFAELIGDDLEGAENLCHLGRCCAERGPPSSAGRAGLGPSGPAMIFGLWA
jgi:hypothetical protein